MDDDGYLAISPMLGQHPLCPEGECKDFWESTDEDGITRLMCGWCGQVRFAIAN